MGEKKEFIFCLEVKKFVVKVFGNLMLYFYEINVWIIGKCFKLGLFFIEYNKFSFSLVVIVCFL